MKYERYRMADRIDSKIDAQFEVDGVWEKLTDMEKIIATQLMYGFTKSEVSKHVGVAHSRIGEVMENIERKLNLKNELRE